MSAHAGKGGMHHRNTAFKVTTIVDALRVVVDEIARRYSKLARVGVLDPNGSGDDVGHPNDHVYLIRRILCIKHVAKVVGLSPFPLTQVNHHGVTSDAHDT